jgi:abnormal spindle-like microcephaly-associated protein
LFRTIRQCDRGANHESVLSSAYDLLENLSADENGPARAVFEARDSITVITEHMQMCRDRPSLVAAATRTVCNLTRDSSRALVVACAGKTLCRIRSISEIMSNTLGTHRHRRLTYIEQQRPDKAREEANAMNALELSIRSVGALIAHLEPFAMKVAGRPPATRSKSRLSERMSTGGRSARSAR